MKMKEAEEELKTLKDLEKVRYIEGEPFCGKGEELVSVEDLLESLDIVGAEVDLGGGRK